MSKRDKPVRRHENAGSLALSELRRAREVVGYTSYRISRYALELEALDTELLRVIAKCDRLAKVKDARLAKGKTTP